MLSLADHLCQVLAQFLVLVALCIRFDGALVLSRACPDDSPLADEILEVCRARILAEYKRQLAL